MYMKNFEKFAARSLFFLPVRLGYLNLYDNRKYTRFLIGSNL